MKIQKHGKTEAKKTEEFICDNCGCEFTVGEGEYYIHQGDYMTGSGLTYTVCAYIKDNYICSCPECYQIVKKVKERMRDIVTCTEQTVTLV